MQLCVMPPVAPMLAKAVDEIPDGADWRYEPKWDGFRTVVFRDGDEVELGSRSTKMLTRYFPELLAPLRAALPERAVVDGEIVVLTERGLDFEALGSRIHPAASRVNRLASELPARVILFDVLALGDEDLRGLSFDERRVRLEAAVAPSQQVLVSPSTTARDVAHRWFAQLEGAGLDGLVAKRGDGAYVENKRLWAKVKHRRSADCVVAGYRMHTSGDGVGSLLLGLYDADGTLHHAGVASGFAAKRRVELLPVVSAREIPLAEHPWAAWGSAPVDGGPEAVAGANEAVPTRMPGAPSRWNGTKNLDWIPVAPSDVVEVGYDFLQSAHHDTVTRFRHPTRLLRWRPDRTAESCTYDQLERPLPFDLDQWLTDPA